MYRYFTVISNGTDTGLLWTKINFGITIIKLTAQSAV